MSRPPTTPPQAPPWSQDPKVIAARKNVEDLLAPGMPTLGDVALDALCAAVASSVPPAPSRIDADHPETTCENCGRRNVVWFAPSSLWNKVARRADGADPMLCPVCFIEMAEAAGIEATAWRVAPEELSASPSPPAPSPDIQDDPGDLYHRPRTKIEPDGRVAMCAGNHDWREPCQWSYRKMTIDELETHLKSEAASPSPPASGEPTREPDAWAVENGEGRLRDLSLGEVAARNNAERLNASDSPNALPPYKAVPLYRASRSAPAAGTPGQTSAP